MERYIGYKIHYKMKRKISLKKAILRRILGKSLFSIYQVYSYNCNVKHYCKVGKHVMLFPPLYVQPQCVELEDYTRMQQGVRIIISEKQKVLIKKYSAIGAGATIIPGNHTPTVSLPQYMSYVRVNDVNNILIVEEDVWVGANSTLLYKGSIGRGAIVAANSVVTKKVPPYAVVSGIPAKVIAVRFSIDQILEHEQHLYPPQDRLSRFFLEDLFKREYEGLKCIGTSTISDIDIQTIKKEKMKLSLADSYNS